MDLQHRVQSATFLQQVAILSLSLMIFTLYLNETWKSASRVIPLTGTPQMDCWWHGSGYAYQHSLGILLDAIL